MNNRRFIHKKLQNYTPALKVSVKPTIKENKEEVKVLDNNSLKESNVMLTTQEKINAVASILSAETEVPVKKLKKDKGLIERTESSKMILTEDNKELLVD